MPGSVYFIASGQLIKIGFSIDPLRRIRDIEAMNGAGVELLATVDGSMRFERAIHRHLEAYREKGEWFNDCPQVRDAIASIVEGGSAAIGFDDCYRDQPKPTRTKIQDGQFIEDPFCKRWGDMSRMLCRVSDKLLIEQPKHPNAKWNPVARLLRELFIQFGDIADTALSSPEPDDDEVVLARAAMIVARAQEALAGLTANAA